MKVSEVMSTDVRVVRPSQTIKEAACMMAEIDAGVLPVGDDDQLVGIITDRDIAIRAVAAGKGPDTPVRDVMSKEPRYGFDDEDVEQIARNMGTLKVRRLPVVNRKKQLVGIISLGDVALAKGADPAGDALASISEPGGAHSQTGDKAA
jgi:CBS domain-containing protein